MGLTLDLLMYLQTADITPFGSWISWWCFALGKQGSTPWRTSWATCKIDFKQIEPSPGETKKTLGRISIQLSSSSRKKLLKISHEAVWCNRNCERVQMSGETSALTASMKPRPIQVCLHVIKRLFHGYSTVHKPIRSEQITRASDSSQISNLLYRTEFDIFCENPRHLRWFFGVSHSASLFRWGIR